jgi:hypothetical protein
VADDQILDLGEPGSSWASIPGLADVVAASVTHNDSLAVLRRRASVALLRQAIEAKRRTAQILRRKQEQLSDHGRAAGTDW